MVKVGYKTYVGIAKEVTFGTFVTSTAFGEFNSESFKMEIAEILVDAINGSPSYKKRLQGQKTVTGSLEVPVMGGSPFILNLVSAITGAAGAMTTLAVGAYSYVFPFRVSNNNNSYSFSISRDTADSTATFNYTGCKVNSAEISCDNAGLLKLKVDFIGKLETVYNSIATASYVTTNPLYFKNGTISIGNSVTVATTTTFQSCGFNFGNNLVSDRVIGDQSVVLLEASRADVTANLEQLWADNSMYNRFINATPTYIKALFSGESLTAAHNNELQIELYNAYCNSPVGNIGNANDLIKQTLAFRSIYSGNDSQTCGLITIKSGSATF